MRRRSLLRLAVGGLVLRAPTARAQARREVRVGVAGLAGALDPTAALEGVGALVGRQVLDTLVAYRDGSTNIEPALATRWTVSRDGLTWTFVIREGARFHDGFPVAAPDVAASFERQLRADAIRAPVWASLLRGVPGVVKDVRAGEGRTVAFTLTQPYAALLTILAHPALGVVRALAGSEGAPRLVGSGPYRLVDVSPGRLALEAVAGHWAGPPGAERILFLEVPTDEHAEAELDAGTLDVWLPPGPPRRIQAATSTPGLRVGYLALQTEKEPFSRRPVRLAIAAAMDPATLAAALDGTGVPLQSFLPPGTWGRREGSPPLGGTRETVRRLLNEGGWPRDQRPTLLVPGEPAGLGAIATAVQAALAAVDIAVQLRTEAPDTVRAALASGDHEMALVEGVVAGGDPHLFLFPLSTSEGTARGPRAFNYSFYRNARIDDILVRASQLTFRPERERLYFRAQALLGEEMPWVPVYVRLLWAVVRPGVRGLRLHPTGLHRLGALTLEG